jgi:hypothetical protein
VAAGARDDAAENGCWTKFGEFVRDAHSGEDFPDKASAVAGAGAGAALLTANSAVSCRVRRCASASRRCIGSTFDRRLEGRSSSTSIPTGRDGSEKTRPAALFTSLDGFHGNAGFPDADRRLINP